MKKIVVVLSIMLGMLGFLFISGCSSHKSSGNNIKVSGQCSPADVTYFDGFYTMMIQSCVNEDAKASFGYYSTGFKGGSTEYMDKLKKNIITLYANYQKIKYDPSNISLTVQGDEAVTSDDFSYSAQPEKNSSVEALNYSGKERLYWKKENGAWRITEWIYY